MEQTEKLPVTKTEANLRETQVVPQTRLTNKAVL